MLLSANSIRKGRKKHETTILRKTFTISDKIASRRSSLASKIASKKNLFTPLPSEATAIVRQLKLQAGSWCLFDQNYPQISVLQQPKMQSGHNIFEQQIGFRGQDELESAVTAKENKPKVHGRWIGWKQNKVRQIASLTKIMTTILAIEQMNRLNLSQQIRISITESSARAGGTTARLKPNTYVKLTDLLYGTMLPSGNDAATLIAEVFGLLLTIEEVKKKQIDCSALANIQVSRFGGVGYFVGRFVKEMNLKAKKLKLFNTSFANPHGLSNIYNHSSAFDVIKLCRYCYKNEVFRKIISTQVYFSQVYPSADSEQPSQTLQWRNTNKLLERGWEGVKTGMTMSAGSCLASIKDGIFICVLGCSDSEGRFIQTEKIFEWYSRNK